MSQPRRLYHESAYDPAVPVASYWSAVTPPFGRACPPLDGAATADVAVIGAGYTGLAAAERLARDHGVSVRVLDAGEPGWGASGRNGGFCCIGGAGLSFDELVRRYGLDETRRFFHIQRDAIAGVRAFLSKADPSAVSGPDGELVLAHKPDRAAALKEDVAVLAKAFDLNAPIFDRAGLAEQGVCGPGFHAGALTPIGFAVNPLGYVRARARAAIDAGAIIHAGSAVTGWREEGGRHLLTTARGELRVRTVIVATNGYVPEHIVPPLAGRALPVMSNILVTRPLTEAEWRDGGWTTDRMAFDTRILLHYFRRLPDGRFLFGGRGGLDASPNGLGAMRRRLRRDFEMLFPAWADVETAYFWSGLACLARGLVPFVGPLDGVPNAFAALAYHGNGVAFSGWAGRAVADCAASVDGALGALPAVVRGPLRPFPFPRFRLAYLRAAYAGFGFIDNYI